jgi:hypothetical protein
MPELRRLGFRLSTFDFRLASAFQLFGAGQDARRTVQAGSLTYVAGRDGAQPPNAFF